MTRWSGLRICAWLGASLSLAACARIASPRSDAHLDSSTPERNDGAVDVLAEDSGAPDLDVDVPDADAIDDDAWVRGRPDVPRLRAGVDPPTILSHVRLVTITFAGDSHRSDIERFGQWIVGSRWLRAAGEEYGVGNGTYGGHVELPMSAPAEISSSELRGILVDRVADGTLEAPTDQTLYVLHVPESTTELASTWFGPRRPRGCVDWYGYHAAATVPSADGGHLDFQFAVIDECPSGALFGLDTASSMQLSTAHEVIEAATDETRGGFSYITFDYRDPWRVLGPEAADLCLGELMLEDGFTVQRVFSNRAAERPDTDPCAPWPDGEDSFGAYPEPNEVVFVAGTAATTIALRGYAARAGPDWNIGVYGDPRWAYAPTIALDRTTLNRGTSASVTLQYPPDAPEVWQVLFVTASRGDPTNLFESHSWPLAVYHLAR